MQDEHGDDMEGEQGKDMGSEQNEVPEVPSAPTVVEKKQRIRRKKGKIDEVLTSLQRIVDFLSDTDFSKAQIHKVTQEIRASTEVNRTFLPKLLNIDKLGDFLGNIYACSASTNGFMVATHGFVVASHAELVKLNASLIELTQEMRTLQASRPPDISRPEWAPPASAAPPSVFSLQSVGPPPGFPPPSYGPPPGYPGAQPQYVGAPPPPQPSPAESIVSLLVDITDQQKYKLARDLGLFATHDEDDFLRTDGLRQAQWIAERLPNPALAIPGIKEKVAKYREFRTNGYKHRKPGASA